MRSSVMTEERLGELVSRYHVQHVLCCFSGGADSLVATHLAHEELQESGIPVEVLHVDTTVSLPGVEEYVEDVCRRLGWRLVVVRPERSFWELASRWGMATRNRRWCCYHLKLRPMFEYAASLGKRIVAFVTGLRRSESARRQGMRGVHRRVVKGVIMYTFSPLLGWDGRQVREYIAEHELPLNPVSEKLGFSGECWCGVFASSKQLLVVRAMFPEFIERFAELEGSWRVSKERDDYHVFWAGGKRLKARDLLAQRVLDEYMG